MSAEGKRPNKTKVSQARSFCENSFPAPGTAAELLRCPVKLLVWLNIENNLTVLPCALITACWQQISVSQSYFYKEFDVNEHIQCNMKYNRMQKCYCIPPLVLLVTAFWTDPKVDKEVAETQENKQIQQYKHLLTVARLRNSRIKCSFYTASWNRSQEKKSKTSQCKCIWQDQRQRASTALLPGKFFHGLRCDLEWTLFIRRGVFLQDQRKKFGIHLCWCSERYQSQHWSSASLSHSGSSPCLHHIKLHLQKTQQTGTYQTNTQDECGS